MYLFLLIIIAINFYYVKNVLKTKAKTYYHIDCYSMKWVIENLKKSNIKNQTYHYLNDKIVADNLDGKHCIGWKIK